MCRKRRHLLQRDDVGVELLQDRDDPARVVPTVAADAGVDVPGREAQAAGGRRRLRRHCALASAPANAYRIPGNGPNTNAVTAMSSMTGTMRSPPSTKIAGTRMGAKAVSRNVAAYAARSSMSRYSLSDV